VKEKSIILIFIIAFALLDYKTHYKPERINAPSVSDSYMGYTYTSNWDRSNHKTYPESLEELFMGGELTKK
jgi:hypothetical protein